MLKSLWLIYTKTKEANVALLIFKRSLVWMKGKDAFLNISILANVGKNKIVYKSIKNAKYLAGLHFPPSQTCFLSGPKESIWQPCGKRNEF